MPGSRILLAHSYYLKYDPKQTRKMKPYPPLATLHLAGYLRKLGHEVALFDAMLAEGEHAFAQALAGHRPDLVVLFEDNFNFLSKMCLTRMREAALNMVRLAAGQGRVVVAAGSDMSDHPEFYLDAGADAVAIGEGDHAVAEIAALISGPSPAALGADGRTQLLAGLESIPGLVFNRVPGGRAQTASRAPERQPDRFGPPAWDLVDFGRYREAWLAAHGRFSLNMASTRGCPFHCNWCAKPIWGQRYAMRNPAGVAEEMATLCRIAQPDHIWFADDIFGLKPGWVADFGREVNARGCRIPFTIQSRVDLMTPDAVEGLRLAGCEEVWLGAESGSQHVLDAMDKGTSISDIHAARSRLRQAGIRASFFIQFGYPGEAWADIVATLNLIATAAPDDIGVSVSYPLPGTRFHDMVRAQLGAKHNWSDSDDLAVLFEGAYPSEFYRALRDFAHLDHDARRADAPALQARRDAAWAELVSLEARLRSRAPTRLPGPGQPLAVPDLSLGWN
ncbi:MAG: radical SAM protein [Thermoflexales bacterium]